MDKSLRNNHLFKEAFRLLVAGRSVMPVKKDKRPYLKSWAYLQKTHPSEEDLVEWWTKWPDANVAMITGKISGISVIDVDTYKGADASPFPLTYTVKTGQGGIQLYYQYVEGFTISANKYERFPFVDIKSDGGYVLVPPSITDFEKDGKKAGGAYTVEKKIGLRPFPAHLFPEETAGVKKTADPSLIAVGMKKGSRNTDMASYIGALLSRTKPEEWESIVYTSALGVNRMAEHPLSEHEVRSVFDSIRKRELKKNKEEWNKQKEEKKKQKEETKKKEKEDEEKFLNFEKIFAEENPHLIYCTSGDFYEYQDGVYIVVHTEEVRNRLLCSLEEHEMIKHKTSYDAANILMNFKAIKGRMVRQEDFDTNENILNVKNGLFDLKTLTLLPHDPSYLTSVQIQTNYDPTATSPLWEKAIEHLSAGDIEQSLILKQFAGYCLTTDTHFDASLFLVGQGATGKSTYASTLLRLLGRQNATTVGIQELNTTFGLAPLVGKRLNWFNEVPTQNYLESNRYKSLVSGEEQSIERKYQDAFLYKPITKFLWTVNEIPRVADTSEGAYRRIIIVQCDNVYNENERDPEIDKKLQQESSGILNWMIEGLVSLREQGKFTIAQKNKTALQEYRIENSGVLEFIMYCFDPTTGEDSMEYPARNLYYAYRKYCEDTGRKAKSETGFGREMKSVILEGYTIDKKRGEKGVVYLGLQKNKNNEAEPYHTLIASQMVWNQLHSK